MNSDCHRIFIGTSVHHWNDNRILYKEAVSLAKKYHVELHAPAEFDKKHLKGVDIHGSPDLDLIVWGQHTKYGIKYSGVGHDGEKDSTKEYLNKGKINYNNFKNFS